MKRYLVGGYVRDSLLNLPTHDKDWVLVGAEPATLIAQDYKQVGKDFPVFLHPQTAEEYALARIERKSGHGYKGFTVYAAPDVTLKQDLSRRDLTINAIAMDDHKHIIDPFNGQQDLEQKILRHVSPAFSEDPLRILRVARFAARFHSLGFTIADETLQLMTDMVKKNELAYLATERIWKETEKALQTPHPEVYFYVLQECGAFSALFPLLTQQFVHCSDIERRSFSALKNSVILSDSPCFRFAVFCHLLGHNIDNSNKNKQYDKVKQLTQQLTLPNTVSSLITLFVQHHAILLTPHALTAEALLYLFDSIDLWRKPENLSSLILCVKAILAIPPHQYWPLEDKLHHAAALAKQIDVQQIIAAGFKNADIRAELTNRRYFTLSTYLTHNIIAD